MKPLIFLKDRQKHIPCVTDAFVNGTNKKKLGLVFVIFLFSAVPAAAKISIVPVFPGLQKAFERGDLSKDRLAQIRDSVRVKQVWPADIEADCTFRPVRLKFSLKEGGDISGKGLRFVLRTEKKNAGKRTFTIRSDGEAVLNEIRPEDLPARLEIPLLAYETVLRNPARGWSAEKLEEMLEKCPCDEKSYGFLLRQYVGIMGPGTVRVRITGPEAIDLGRLTPMRVDVSGLNQPLCGIEVRFKGRNGKSFLPMKTDNAGRVVFTSAVLDDFPLSVRIPVLSYTRKDIIPDTKNRELILFVQGNAALKAGDFSRAVFSFTRFIDLNGNIPEVFNNRGYAKYGLGDKEGAVRDYTRALELNPRFAAAYFNRGGVFSEAGNFRAALRDFDEAIKYNPENGVYYINRALAYRKTGTLSAALKDLDRAVTILPDTDRNHLDARFIRGGVHYEMKQYTQALGDWDFVISTDPDNARAYYYRGSTRCLVDRKVQGLSDLRKSCDLGCREACTLYDAVSSR